MDRQLYDKKLEELKNIQADGHHALRIAMCGKFKSGKTSLLNLMLGTDLPVKSTTATGIITKIVYGKASVVKMKDGEIKSTSVQELYDYISVVDKNLDGITIGDARCAYIGSRSKLLKRGKVEFWDTPGLEDDPELTQITMDAINQCDFLVYVMHANQVLSQYEKRLFPKLDKLMNGNIIFVVNHMDLLRSDEKNDVITTINSALGNYHNRFMPEGSVFFTSANPNNPDISSFTNSIIQMCKDKETRINILNLTKNGKSSVLEEDWKAYILEDIEETEKHIKEFQQLIEEDIEQKKGQLEDTYARCVDSCKRIQKDLEASVMDESSWRMVLIDYQNVSGWETNFMKGSAELIKGRMAKLIQQGNEAIQNTIKGSVFESDSAAIVLNDRIVWRNANWYKNFSRPLFFPETRFRQFRSDCVEKCIGALMTNPVKVVKDVVSSFFSSFFSNIDHHYHIEMISITGAPELLSGLDDANSDLSFIIEYQNNIAAIQSDIQKATVRNRLSYKLRDFFSFFFTGMLADEIYN